MFLKLSFALKSDLVLYSASLMMKLGMIVHILFFKQQISLPETHGMNIGNAIHRVKYRMVTVQNDIRKLGCPVYNIPRKSNVAP